MKRRRLLVAVVMVAGLVTGAAGPATAIDLPSWMSNPLECPPGIPASKTPPVPKRPDNVALAGDANFNGTAFHPHDQSQADGDPFAPGSQVSILDQYGYAGLEWHTYDLGCGGDLADPFAAMHTQWANWMMLIPTTVLQVLGFVSSTFGRAEWLSVLDAPITALGHAISAGPFRVLFPLTTLALGSWLAHKASKHSTADAMSVACWWLVLTVMAVALTAAPNWAVHQTDEVFDFGMGAVRETFGPNAGPLADVGPVHRDAMYSAWLTGTFGAPDSPAAQKYGAELFKAQAFSWQELHEIGSDAGRYNQAVQAKQHHWMEIAESVKNEYPDAYYNLQGKSGGTRFMAAFGATLFVIGLSWFLLWAGIAFIRARVTIRLVVIAVPLAVILGVFPKHRHHVIGLWNMLVSSIVRAAVSLFAAGVASVMVGAVLMAPNTSQLAKIAVAWVVSFVAWKASKPFRGLGMLSTGAWGVTKNVATAALGTKIGVGGKAGGLPPRKEADGPPATPHESSSRTEYDVGHARTRVSGATGAGYRPASTGNPLRSGMSAIDAVPSTEDGETVYRAKPRPETSHRRVNHDQPAYRDARVRPDPASAGHRPDPGRVTVKERPAPAPRSRLRPDAGDASWYDRPVD